MDAAAFHATARYLKQGAYFDSQHPFYALVEVAVAGEPEDDHPGSERLLEFTGLVEENIVDGIIAQGEGQARQIWELRESAALAIVDYGYSLQYDVSLPSKHYYRLVEETKRLCQEHPDFTEEERSQILAVGYGHVGDGNVHLNVAIPGYSNTEFQEKLNRALEPFVMSFVKSNHGSVSAEHGIGFQKTGFLDYSKSPEMISYMRKIKHAFDPVGIMNPYKVLPA